LEVVEIHQAHAETMRRALAPAPLGLQHHLHLTPVVQARQLVVRGQLLDACERLAELGLLVPQPVPQVGELAAQHRDGRKHG
ncbi:hypothetical protein ACP60_27695, partial [Escherichia coli]